MAIADNRQRCMPLPDDRMSGRCQTLAFAEAVLLLDPKNKELAGEVLLSQFPTTVYYVNVSFPMW